MLDPFEFAIMIIGSIVVLSVIYSSFFIVNGKTAAILETFGRPHKAARTPGLQFKMPWPITQVVGIVKLQQQEVAQEVSVKTKDNSFMTLPVKVQYKASSNPESSVKAYYELEDAEQQITSYILNNVRQTATSLDMVELYSNRSDMEETVQENLTERFEGYGYVIENVLVDEPQQSKEVRDAFNRVIASVREKEAEQKLADGKRIDVVGIATAEKESKKLQGEGISAMRDEIAKGLQAAIKEITDAGLTTQEAVDLLKDTNRLDTLGSAAVHGNMILVDMKSGGDQIANTFAAVNATNKP